MPTHRIALRGPWEFVWLTAPRNASSGDSTSVASSAKEGRLTMPMDWTSAFGAAAGTVRFTRRFHWLSEREPGELVEIVFDDVGGHGPVSLNGESLGELIDAPARFEVTHLLQRTNALRVDLTYEPDDSESEGRGGLCALVALEIHPPEDRFPA